jgi:hypothetical protein
MIICVCVYVICAPIRSVGLIPLCGSFCTRSSSSILAQGVPWIEFYERLLVTGQIILRGSWGHRLDRRPLVSPWFVSASTCLLFYAKL